ncbi:MAG: protein kinase domain-containing protein [Gammaproteobacteria bacterium]
MQIKGYSIRHAIGEGGMATAYLAIQESLGRPVVLKVLHTARSANPQEVERFKKEGRIIASLNHPNIITVFDIDTAGDAVYLAMEYIEGGDLRKRMSGILTPYEALDILIKVGGALSAAHKKGIIHRDVKPANILFRKDGTPLLSDFGIAKQTAGDNDLTQTGIFLGSPNYMAPEQAETGSIDGRADLYSLGVIFYEMLTGMKPFYADSAVDVIVQHKRAPIPTLPTGLDQYQALLNLMLAKHRKDRFRDAESLLHYVRHLLQSGTLKTERDVAQAPEIDVSGPQPFTTHHDQAREIALPRAPRSRRTRYWLCGGLGAAVIGYVALYYAESSVGIALAPTPPAAGRLIATLPPKSSPTSTTPPKLMDRGTTLVDRGTTLGAPASDEVVQALRWLARKSLADYRLTDPPRDNAFYYYSRLRDIEPGNEEARRGILEIANRFALLAERELASQRYREARSYVAMGLHIDPANASLVALKPLADHPPRGLIARLADLFAPH